MTGGAQRNATRVGLHSTNRCRAPWKASKACSGDASFEMRALTYHRLRTLVGRLSCNPLRTVGSCRVLILAMFLATNSSRLCATRHPPETTQIHGSHGFLL